MRPTRAEKLISHLFQNIAPAPRIQILLAIGQGEACVCHLEAMLGHRQAYISQHLMALREAEIVSPRREGRNIYYRLTNPQTLTLIHQAGILLGLREEELQAGDTNQHIPNCLCPHCNEEPSGFIPTSAVTYPTV